MEHYPSFLFECLFFFGAIKPRHRVRVGQRRPFILMSLPPTSGDHLDIMFPACTDLALRTDGQSLGEIVDIAVITDSEHGASDYNTYDDSMHGDTSARYYGVYQPPATNPSTTSAWIDIGSL